MTEQTLPAVASRVYTVCKKCDAERYHIVLAHTTATSAKVECEICHSKKTFKLAGSKPSKPKAVTGAAATKRAAAAETRKNAHSKEYGELIASAEGDAETYSMKAKFAMNQVIKHPKFGMGVIKSSLPDKVEVMFEDEVRTLVHNRA
jgi:hypothetical protein